ncbi:triose-phosphate isomerase family protein, partial [Pseudomonas shirazensis]
MRRPMVAGNWKMHGTRASVAELTEGLGNLSLPAGVEVAVFPPALFVTEVINGLQGKGIIVGAQNSAIQPEQGALTGEVAPSQWAEVGCKLVLIGHSERRQIIGETDEVLNCKFAAAQAGGLTPVLCV